MHYRWVTAAVLALLGGVMYTATLAQHPVQSIPAGFDFPADKDTLLRLRDTNDVVGMRRHAWLVFAGLTEPTATGEAVWETWYSKDETFGGAQPQALTPRKIQRRFEVPRQFKGTGLHPQAVGSSLASFTLFNEELRGFVREKKLYQWSTLKSINDSFGPQTPVEKREIPEFPTRAVAIKTAWWIVKQTGTTPVPIWDPESNPALPEGNRWDSWTRCVMVDPSRLTVPDGETTNMSCNMRPPRPAAVVPLSAFYHFALTADDLKALQNMETFIPNVDKVEVGDYVALVALHYTTKEISDWVWATFWWHDKPDTGAFAADRPPAVKGVWRNYLMTTSYSMNTPAEPDGTPHAAFNPWLEARFADGLVSNCMTCHRRAIFSNAGSDFDFLPITRGAPVNDPRFDGATKLDFLWSVLRGAQ